MLSKKFPWLAVLGLAVSFLVHYFAYAFRFMWYLSYPDFILLIEIYVAFIVIEIIEFVFFSHWWVMGGTAFFVMFMPAVFHIKYLLPIGVPFCAAALVAACPFVAVAFLRQRARGSRQMP